MCFFVNAVVGNRGWKIGFFLIVHKSVFLGTFRRKTSRKERTTNKEEEEERGPKSATKTLQEGERESSPKNRPKSGKEDETHNSGSTRTQNPRGSAHSFLGLCLRSSPTTAAQTSNQPRSYGSIEPTRDQTHGPIEPACNPKKKTFGPAQ